MDHADSTKPTSARDRAQHVTNALLARYRGRLSEDARTVVSFWLASEAGAERAAQQLIDFASALGVDVNAVVHSQGEQS